MTDDNAFAADHVHLMTPASSEEIFTGCPGSSRIEQLVIALSKAQAEFGPIEKDKTAKINSPKGNYSYDYADLATILTVVRPVLAKHGLAVFQPVSMNNGTVNVKTVVAHGSGQWIANEIGFKAGDGDPRSVAGVITYGRRYGLITMIGVAPSDEDNDAPSVPEAKASTAKLDGYDDWLLDMQALADEGEEPLRQAWTKSNFAYRNHLTKQDPTTWAAMKAKAATATANANVRGIEGQS